MASHNRVILLGNVTRDIELRYTPSGMAVTDMGMAVNDRRKNQQTGEWIEEVTFVDVTLWGRTAEVAGEYLSKGAPVFIEGRLKLDTWEKDGKKNYKLHVIGERLQLIGSRQGGGGGGGGGGRTAPQQSYDEQDYGEPDAAPPQRSAPPRAPQAAAPPPGDDIPF
jgi:single-strand DNA-binding protein